MCEEQIPVKTEQKNFFLNQHSSCYQPACICHLEVTSSLLFLVDVHARSLSGSSFYPLPIPVPVEPWHSWPYPHSLGASLYSYQVTCPCFHCLCVFFLLSSLSSRSHFSHAVFSPSFPDFLHLGLNSSCALRKTSLKKWQGSASSAPLPCPWGQTPNGVCCLTL